MPGVKLPPNLRRPLRDLLPNPHPRDAYFSNLDKTLAEGPQALQQFRDLEKDLQGLDPLAWNFLKSELAPLLTARHPTRGWQALFDKLNQAKAYNYLKNTAGYSKVEFILVSTVKGQQTPDLRGEQASTMALCEVKTINVSELEAQRRTTSDAGMTTDQLDDRFFRKLGSVLAHATEQMLAHDANPATKKIAYVIVNFDDLMHEYADRYRSQIDNYLANNSPHDSAVFFDIEPAYYAAMD